MYLGVPTITGRVTKGMFQNVITRVDNRLAGWKAKCLSLAGRVTLIKSTITAIPAYAMQSACLPCSICDDLDKRIRRFLWGGTTLERKPHLVNWAMVIKEKSQGGLGIRSMRQLNSAYLMKLGWRLKTEHSTLWVRLIQDKYGRGRDLDSLVGRPCSGSNAWHGIMETLEMTNRGMGVALGDGCLTEFWNHRWLDGKKLSDYALHPIPVRLSSSRVCDFWQPDTGWKWTGSHLLPSEILQRIASFALANEELSDQPM